MEQAIRKISGVGWLWLLVGVLIPWWMPSSAEAIPAFARKYDQVCNTCHTRMPRLNWYGQRFLENGYQLPGVEDGGRTGKRLLRDLTLDEVRNYLAVRIRADVEQFQFHDPEATEADEDVNFQVPDVVNVYFAGTAFRNMGYFLETEWNEREAHGGLIFERAFVVFSNLTGNQALNFKVGRFDPSSMFSFPTHRQQLNPIGAFAHTDDFPAEINRIPLLPLAYSAKFFGLTSGAGEGDEGFSILPFQPSLFNHPALKGATFYGRPLGDPFLYQVGIVQSDRADGENGYDYYGMLRWDIVRGEYTAANVSAFYYKSKDAANLTLHDPVEDEAVQIGQADWNRWGIGARLTYKALDIYAAWVLDRLDFDLPGSGFGSTSQWDDTAWGFSLEADWLATEKWLLSARYDMMDGGGLTRMPNGTKGPADDSAWLALQARYYPQPNVALYARGHLNLKSGGSSPTRNLRSAVLVGLDMAF